VERRQREQQLKEEEEARKKDFEVQQLKRVEIHPYLQELETCEQLIYFCARHRIDVGQAAAAVE